MPSLFAPATGVSVAPIVSAACIDSDTNCATYVPSGVWQCNVTSYVSQICRLSCRFCVGPTVPTTESMAPSASTEPGLAAGLNCGGPTTLVLGSTPVVISNDLSANLLSDYQPNMKCVWIVLAGGPITLTFSVFMTEAFYDKLEVFDGGSAAADTRATYTFSGLVPPPALTTQSASLRIVFSTDATIAGRGFLARLSTYSPYAPYMTQPPSWMPDPMPPGMPPAVDSATGYPTRMSRPTPPPETRARSDVFGASEITAGSDETAGRAASESASVNVRVVAIAVPVLVLAGLALAAWQRWRCRGLRPPKESADRFEFLDRICSEADGATELRFAHRDEGPHTSGRIFLHGTVETRTRSSSPKLHSTLGTPAADSAKPTLGTDK
jgi:hypothetical protein